MASMPHDVCGMQSTVVHQPCLIARLGAGCAVRRASSKALKVLDVAEYESDARACVRAARVTAWTGGNDRGWWLGHLPGCSELLRHILERRDICDACGDERPCSVRAYAPSSSSIGIAVLGCPVVGIGTEGVARQAPANQAAARALVTVSQAPNPGGPGRATILAINLTRLRSPLRYFKLGIPRR